MSRNADWLAIEAHYRAGAQSVNSLAKEHGVSEGTIRARAKKHGWMRDPEGAKRELVKAAMAGVTKQGANYELRNVLETEAGQDVADMRLGLEVARLCLANLSRLAAKTSDARILKVIADANRVSVETIRKIRGLDDQPEEANEVQAILARLRRIGEEVER